MTQDLKARIEHLRWRCSTRSDTLSRGICELLDEVLSTLSTEQTAVEPPTR